MAFLGARTARLIRGWLQRLIVAVAVLVALVSSPAHAQLREDADVAAPPDVSLERNLTIPALPPGFVTERAGTITFEMPEAAQSTMREVIDSAATEWIRITSDLGAEPGGPLLVRIGRNPDEMASLAPLEAPPPDYAVGVAYPELDLVLLTLTAPETWERPDLRHVFMHELAHVALHRAVVGDGMSGPGGRPLPRWLDEGIAIHEAGERSIERVETLWQGTISDQLIPLDRLDRGFGGRPHSVGLAYAQSADFVAWLIRRGDDGPRKLRQVLERVRNGASFPQAIEITYSQTIGQLDDEWRVALSERYGATPLLLGSGLAWAIVAVLIVLAFRKRRQNNKQVLARWGEEERIEDERAALRARAHQILAARRALEDERLASPPQPAAEAAPKAAPAEEPELDADTDMPVPPPQPEVPSIEWEGDRHTLH